MLSGMSAKRTLRLLPALLLTGLLLLSHACGGSSDSGGDKIKLEEQGDKLVFSNGKTVATIDTERFGLALSQDGKQLAAVMPGSLAFERDGQPAAVGTVSKHTLQGNALEMAMGVSAGASSASVTWLTDRTLKVEVALPPDITAFSEAVALQPDEQIYGLSERVSPPPSEEINPILPPPSELQPKEAGSLNRRGEIVEEYVRPTMAIYAPFYQSTSGYGLYVANTTPGTFDVGVTNPDELSFRFETGSTPESQRLTYYLFAGDYKQVLDEYTSITGRPYVPPDWAFKHWRWRDELPLDQTAELDGVTMNAWVADDLSNYEKYGIPPGVYLIDRPWQPGEFGFARFEWDPARLPNAGAMLNVIKQRGYKLAVFTTAWALGDGPQDNRAEATAGHYLAPNSNRTVDMTNPAATEWWWGKHIDFTKQYGVSLWKLDRGEEQIPSETTDIWSNGENGRELRNTYPLRQLQTFRDALDKAGDKDVVIFARAGYAGSQHNAIFWGGDSAGADNLGAGPGTDLGLRNAIIELQRVGFMGFPIWGSDTGGYYEFKDRDAFARWLEFSAFTPIMEIGGHGTHAPWDMPTEPRVDDEMIAIYKKYVLLHHALLDYTKKYAAEAGKTGVPIARALAIEFPDDVQARDRWDEFMYGDDVLVAPVWRTGERSREVYLPKGTWEDFWDKSKTFAGPQTITVDAPLDSIPLFVRKGADVAGR
jgi:alpha-glucosidase (family GH31 glycosyl hydrolase)